MTTRLYVVALTTLAAAPAAAQLIDVRSVQTELVGTPAGHVVNDLFIDYEGQPFGQQMLLELSQGEIYLAPPSGFPPFCTIPTGCDPPEVDSFVTFGDRSSGGIDILIIGSASELGGDPASPGIATDGANIAWGPAPGVVFGSGSLWTARLILTDDADGTIKYLSVVSGVPTIKEGLVLSGVVFAVPEPATLLLAGLAAAVAATRRR